LRKLSVIIVNYKGWQALDECLLTLDKFISKNLTLEVIIVDNCSNDGNLELFRKKYTSFTFILNSDNNGFANGCNLGADNASSEYLLFLNPDTKVDSKNLELFFESYLQNQDELAVLSCLQVDENGKFYNQYNLLPKFYSFFGISRAIYRFFYKHEITTKFRENNEFFYPEWITGAVVLISKKWFDSVKGWNEDYWMYMEDVDFCKRIIDAKGKVAVYKNAIIYHKHGGSSRINIATKGLTKAEVIISKHVYINANFSKINSILLHFLLFTGVISEKLFLTIIGFPLFFVRKLQVNKIILKYYFYYVFHLIRNKTFISSRALKYKSKVS
jgi:GT2 family glycosyltransferase